MSWTTTSKRPGTVGRWVTGFAAWMFAAYGLASTAHAEDQWLSPDRYASYGLEYLATGSGRNADYGLGVNFGYAGRLGTNRWWELKLSTTIIETGGLSPVDFYQSALALDLLQPLNDENGAHYFALAGLGIAANDVAPNTNDGVSEFFNAGIGHRWKASSVWGFRPRADVRYVYDTFDSGTSDFRFGLTLEILPSRTREIEKIVQVEKIVEVPVVIEKVVEKDVACVIPAVPAATEGACPPPLASPAPEPDSDGDGVPDSKDRCPQTLQGAKVDAEGCVRQEQTINLPNIEFESGKAVLAVGGKEKLEAVVSFLQNQAGVRVDVFGHTDSQGADTFNQTLSDKRARAVMDYLISRGIAGDRLSSKGFGETQPIASNETAKGRAQNRRVELLIRAEP